MEQYGIINIAGADFENAELKNRWIAQTMQPLLIYANQNVVSGEEIAEMLTEYPYMEQTKLLVFCEHAPETADWYGILMDPEMKVYAMVIDRELFAEVSSFNFRLDDGSNREFLCRAAEVCEPVFLECSEVEWSRPVLAGVCRTNAYLLVRYLQQLKKKNGMDPALQKHLLYARALGYQELFEEQLHRMLSEDRSYYERIYLATAPFFIIRGSDICYGVLRTFANQLAEALGKRGQRVITTEGGERISDGQQLQLLENEHFRGIIGFQATIMFQKTFDFVKGMRFNFWFDHPMFFHTLFDKMESPAVFLCQDEDHADYINQYFPKATGVQFPPGAVMPEHRSEEKIYDISFMGTYFNEQEMRDVVAQQKGILGQLSEACIEFLLAHPQTSYNELKEILLQQYPDLFEEYPFEVIANGIWEATRIAPYAYRNRVIRLILQAGFELHVYGDSWKAFQLKEGERLVIHEQVAPEKMCEEMSKSKISLNVMSWHKAGMTERIIEIMMSGSVCLTDETRYLKRHFTQMEDIVMFELDHLEKLPELIRQLLDHEDLRQQMTAKAYQKVAAEHTWDARTGQLLDLVTAMEEDQIERFA